MERKIIVVDVDGVLCDLVGSAIPVINSLYDCNLNRTDIRMFEMDRILGVKKGDFDKEVFQRIDYSKMQLIEGAAEGLAQLAIRFRIVVATNRPPDLYSKTKKWLVDNALTFHAFMSAQETDSTVAKKSDLYPMAEVVIDDDLREVIAAYDFTKVTCLFDAPWNHSINAQGRFLRCRDWNEIVDVCMSSSGISKQPEGMKGRNSLKRKRLYPPS